MGKGFCITMKTNKSNRIAFFGKVKNQKLLRPLGKSHRLYKNDYDWTFKKDFAMVFATEKGAEVFAKKYFTKFKNYKIVNFEREGV